MTKIKESSTNQSNKATALFACPVTFTLTKIGGRWKPLIIYNLLEGPKRYSALKKLIPAITEKMLIQHLKELEADQLVSRQALAIVPPHVEYSLTPSGRALGPAMQEMANWGFTYRDSDAQ
ncbi:winged helix-turn-helix transcriptional regulator [Adhaeribacter pallidiroseus]|uniref:Putative HTH-type transcriptional regulator n=1 Tax=Adhaeribacter pallidiroseus TaxID=2072847 RepID=A0A369QGJ9_9BACT|nr:helix-turn-helix domain-containing protein [Adhaeribacter pallidiroseus]RDC62356.1 putative HTH-type transcriptional regulator [Adhaeribacter pallidiroseus]